MKNIILAALSVIALAACSSQPPKLRQPNDKVRVPVNTTVPLEVLEIQK